MKHLLTSTIIAVLIASLVAMSFVTAGLTKINLAQLYRISELEQEIEQWKSIVEAQADGSFRLFIEPIEEETQ